MAKIMVQVLRDDDLHTFLDIEQLKGGERVEGSHDQMATGGIMAGGAGIRYYRFLPGTQLVLSALECDKAGDPVDRSVLPRPAGVDVQPPPAPPGSIVDEQP